MSSEHSPMCTVGHQLLHFAPLFTGFRGTLACPSVSPSIKWEEARLPAQKLAVTMGKTAVTVALPFSPFRCCTPQRGGRCYHGDTAQGDVAQK